MKNREIIVKREDGEGDEGRKEDEEVDLNNFRG